MNFHFANKKLKLLLLIMIPIWYAKASGQTTADCTYPIIFIHGWDGGAGSWEDFANELQPIFGNAIWEPYPPSQMYGTVYYAHLNYHHDNQNTHIFGVDTEPDGAIYENDDVLLQEQIPGGPLLVDYQCIYAISFKTQKSKIDNEFIIPNDARWGKDNFISEPSDQTDSNEASIAKQGYALGRAIDNILQATKKEKVILMAHSMGGLAAREYLQRIENGKRKWWVNPNDAENGHKVAKLITLVTPHRGSNSADRLAGEIITMDLNSEAVRDLRYNYDSCFFFLNDKYTKKNTYQGVALFGGIESKIPQLTPAQFYNYDVNCNGIVDNNIGLNMPGFLGNGSGTFSNLEMDLPESVKYTYIVSNKILNTGNGERGDAIVAGDRQWLFFGGDGSELSYLSDENPSVPYPFKRGMPHLNSDRITFPNKVAHSANLAKGLKNPFKQTDILTQALDEGDYPYFAHAIKVADNPTKWYFGLAQKRADIVPSDSQPLLDHGENQLDADWYKFTIDEVSNITINIRSELTSFFAADLFIETPDMFDNEDYGDVRDFVMSDCNNLQCQEIELRLHSSQRAICLTPGTYYFRITHLVLNEDDWKRPYKFQVISRESELVERYNLQSSNYLGLGALELQWRVLIDELCNPTNVKQDILKSSTGIYRLQIAKKSSGREFNLSTGYKDNWLDPVDNEVVVDAGILIDADNKIKYIWDGNGMSNFEGPIPGETYKAVIARPDVEDGGFITRSSEIEFTIPLTNDCPIIQTIADSPNDGYSLSVGSTYNLTWHIDHDDEDCLDEFEVQTDISASFVSPNSNFLDRSSLEYEALEEGEIFWRVRAKNNDGIWGSWSTTRSVSVEDDEPGIPGDGTCNGPDGLMESNISRSRAEISWSPIEGVDSYIVYHARSGQSYTKKTGRQVAEDVLFDLRPETVYNWYVESVCLDGTTSLSETKSFSTLRGDQFDADGDIYLSMSVPNTIESGQESLITGTAHWRHGSNGGLPATMRTNINFYVSSSSSVDDIFYRLGSRSITLGRVSSTQNYTSNTDYSYSPDLPDLDPGRYVIIAVLDEDDNVIETDESNNLDNEGFDVTKFYGCTDTLSHNFHPTAIYDDGSCKTCYDNIKNGDETEVDCGGNKCINCIDVCRSTSQVAITNITTNSVHISWLEAYNANTYAVLFKPEDSISYHKIYTSTNQIDLNFLQPGARYCFTIQSNCTYQLKNSRERCFNLLPPTFGCTNESAHNYNPDATDEDWQCETCQDGQRNGDEIEVDCGGSLCQPCYCEKESYLIDYDLFQDQQIQARQDVLASGNLIRSEVDLLAGESIRLLPGFHADSDDGTVFTSQIEECEYCAGDDATALLALYQSTDGDNWGNNTGWVDGAAGSNCDPCGLLDGNDAWYGVRCDENKVIDIVLPNNNLKGSLPFEIGDLKYLQDLIIYDNMIEGELPPSLYELENLELLLFYNNQITGEISSDITYLQNLQAFQGANNSLTGPLPSEMGNVRTLTDIWLDNNGLSGTIPSSFGNLSSLYSLHLRNNNLSGTIPAELGSLSSLMHLSLSDNDFDGCLFRELKALCGATVDLSGNTHLADWDAFCVDYSGACPTCDDGIVNGQETGLDCGGPDCIACENPVEFVSLIARNGSVVDISHDFLLAGDKSYNPNHFSGRVAIYENNLNNAVFKHFIYPFENAYKQYFGKSVEIDSLELFIGESFHKVREGNFNHPTGSVYSFKIYNDSAHFIRKIIPSRFEEVRGFGNSISMNGDKLAIAAQGIGTTIPGSVTIYNRADSTWEESIHITGNRWIHFGRDVVLKDSMMVVGAPWDDNRTDVGLYDAAGSVFLYSINDNTYTLINKFYGNWHDDNLGSSVDMSSNFIAIGAPIATANRNATGYVKIIALQENGGWEELQTIRPTEEQADNEFGFSVAMHFGYLLVGAPGENKVYVYELANSRWELLQIILPEAGVTSQRFGNSVAIYENKIIVGSNNNIHTYLIQ